MATRISIVSTKGGVGKTILTANLGALLADLDKRVLLVDADIQPTLSSYYRLADQAPHGLVDVIETGDMTDGISVTTVGCDIILSNDPVGKLPDWILHTPDGRFRLKRLLKRLDGYDFVLIDTQGSRTAAGHGGAGGGFAISPIPPELLSAREFTRGTNRMDRTADARATAEALRALCYGPSRGRIMILDTVIPATVAYREAASAQQPVHRFEPTRQGPTPSGLESMLNLIRELPIGLEEAVLAPSDVPRNSKP